MTFPKGIGGTLQQKRLPLWTAFLINQVYKRKSFRNIIKAAKLGTTD
jgi:hypothetical protein